MPGSFDDVLMIDGGGGLLPSGPTGLETDEKAERLDIWVFQKGACVGVLLDVQGATTWKAKPAQVTRFGAKFEPGPAIAMGLMVYVDGKGVKTLEQWSRAITLATDSA